MVMFSVEVNDGLLSTTLPIHLIETAELKIKSSSQWQPLQTFVTIANQFIMKGRGVRFQGTISDCNNVMQQLFYQGANLEDLLIITVNDLGNYGCHLDCTDIMSFPLSIEASVILIKRRPLNSTTAFLLGSAIFFEIATLFLLGGLLLFFICKCMIALRTERKNVDNSRNNHREELIENHNDKIDVVSFKNAINSHRISTRASLPRGRSLSTPLSLSRKSSNFRQRSRARLRPTLSSYASFGKSLQLTSPYIEMQKQRQSN